MSAITRFGPKVAKSALFAHHPARQMATATAINDPIQKLFVDKVKEFKSSNQGLDQAHQKAMNEEMARLKRVYSIENESQLTKIEPKFAAETNISLHDVDEKKELRAKIDSGEFLKQLGPPIKQRSEILESVGPQIQHDLHLPPKNLANPDIFFDSEGIQPVQVGGEIPDHHSRIEKMTPHLLQREMCVMFSPDMPTIHDDKKPERDVVNFPRHPQNLTTPPTRYHIIPESWFQFFYPKTGVTGPYAFAATFGTFLFSKEWLIYEHEMITAFSSVVVISYAVTKFGPKLSSLIRDMVKSEVNVWENWRLGSLKYLDEVKSHYQNELGKGELIKDIYAIREQDVELQLEHDRRDRVKAIYDDTKRRLNYLVSVADSKRQIAHRNMVNWVINNAVKSIGVKQENEVLDKCITDLKQLGIKNSNMI